MSGGGVAECHARHSRSFSACGWCWEVTLWELAGQLATESLCISLAIISPPNKLFIQNLQIRRLGRESICLWCLFRCQDRHSGLGISWGSPVLQTTEFTVLEGCSCQMTFIYYGQWHSGRLVFVFYLFQRESSFWFLKKQKSSQITRAFSLQDNLLVLLEHLSISLWV